MSDETTNEKQGGSPVPGASADATGAGATAGTGAAVDPVAAGPVAAGPAAGRGRRDDRRGSGGGGGGRGRGQRRDGRFGASAEEEDNGGFEENVVKVYRCATVVKGGRRFSFAALVVVGDRQGQVGVGYGKANEVPNAVEKATKAARRSLIKVKLQGTSIPHQMLAKFGASKVMLLPAGEGTGVIAGASVRAVMELAGVRDVLTKAYGSTSPKNLVKAAFLGLKAMRSKEDVARSRAV